MGKKTCYNKITLGRAAFLYIPFSSDLFPEKLEGDLVMISEWAEMQRTVSFFFFQLKKSRQREHSGDLIMIYEQEKHHFFKKWGRATLPKFIIFAAEFKQRHENSLPAQY